MFKFAYPPLGQVMIDIAGTELTAEDRAILAHPQVGGVILFTRNYVSDPQVRGLTQSIREVRNPLLIATDQEGGRVQRFPGCEMTSLPSLGEIGKVYADNPQKGRELASHQGVSIACRLVDCGVDFSFAPVLDLDKGLNTVIGDRSFGADPETVIELADMYIDGLRSGTGMSVVGKHFPGHGGTTTDSHNGIARDTRTYEELLNEDMRPFIKYKQRLDAMMPAHVIYPDVDEKPAGFSSVWLKSILRYELGYDGAILSDDLMMAGAAVAGSIEARASLALEAGCDMILVCNNREAAIRVLESLPPVDMIASKRLRKLLNPFLNQPLVYTYVEEEACFSI